VTRDLFDRQLRALRRDRAVRIGFETLLFDRAFDECIDRLRDIRRPFGQALLLGCPSDKWPERLAALTGQIDVADPGALMARQVGGTQVDEDRHDFGVGRYDLCVAIGTLDTVNDLPLALQLLRRCLRPDAPIIGAVAGGNSLPALRASLIEAGRAEGKVIMRAHPLIEPASLAQLLLAAGFSMPVVDVDRVRLRYSTLDGLVGDLRAMAATSILAERPPPLTRRALDGTRRAFRAQASDGRTEESIEILHFIGWAK
jgi:NADH dehydrogenase [ubiquinone] 1 alpha subcomplex assembly factor 5